ncbi:hypothetical protein ACFX2H_013021 [Malus domestica]
MKVSVRDSTMVEPVEEMPRRALGLSNLDLVRTINHTLNIYFYKPDQNYRSDFFDPAVLKHALSNALVLFYPLTDRLKQNKGRLEIDYNAKSVLFVVAETTSVDLDYSGDFAPTNEFNNLIPSVDSSQPVPDGRVRQKVSSRGKYVSKNIGSDHHLFQGCVSHQQLFQACYAKFPKEHYFFISGQGHLWDPSPLKLTTDGRASL